MLQLLGEEGELQDRPRDQMREHGNEAGEIDEIGHRFRFAAINIDRVAERLESVKADPEREDDAEESVELHIGPAERFHGGVVAIDAEVEVFEKAEHREIRDHGNDDRGVLRARAFRVARQRYDRPPAEFPHPPRIVRDDQAHDPIDRSRREHEEHEARLGPAIKNVAGDDQPKIPPALRRSRQRVVAEEREGQKVENENVRAEDHAPATCGLSRRKKRKKTAHRP